jgi:ribosome-binding factor A
MEIRKHLGNKIGKRVRKIPEIAFFHDDTEEKASYMDRLIDNLDIPPADEDEPKQD